jgi:hypothetical protein
MSNSHIDSVPSGNGDGPQPAQTNKPADLAEAKLSKPSQKPFEELLAEFRGKPQGLKGRSRQPFEVGDPEVVVRALRAINTYDGLGSGIEEFATQREVVDHILAKARDAYSILNCVFSVAPLRTSYPYETRTNDAFHSSRIKEHLMVLAVPGNTERRSSPSLDLNDFQSMLLRERRDYLPPPTLEGLKEYVTSHSSQILAAINSVSEHVICEDENSLLFMDRGVGLGSFSVLGLPDLELQRCLNTEQEVSRLKETTRKQIDETTGELYVTSLLISHDLVSAVATYNREIREGHGNLDHFRKALDTCQSTAERRKDEFFPGFDGSYTQSLFPEQIMDAFLKVASLVYELNSSVWSSKKVGERITGWLGYPGAETHGLFLMQKGLVDPKFLSTYDRVIGDGCVLCRTNSPDNSSSFPPDWLAVDGGRCGSAGPSFFYKECPWGTSIGFEIEPVLD